MKINIDDLDIYQKTWNYGMQKIAEKILAEAYKVDPKEIVVTKADFKHLFFEGYSVMDWNKKFVLNLKISYELKNKGANKNASQEKS